MMGNTYCQAQGHGTGTTSTSSMLLSKYFASTRSSCIHQNSYYNVDSCISVMVGVLGTSFLNKRYCYVLHILGW